jgi:hypothetical protein
LTSGLFLGFAGLAFAAGLAFEDVDRDKDGRISQQEASAVEGLDFSRLDTNADGWLTRSEYEIAKGSGAPQE